MLKKNQPMFHSKVRNPPYQKNKKNLMLTGNKEDLYIIGKCFGVKSIIIDIN